MWHSHAACGLSATIRSTPNSVLSTACATSPSVRHSTSVALLGSAGGEKSLYGRSRRPRGRHAGNCPVDCIRCGRYQAVRPPSTTRFAPVMYADASETRNTTAALYSSG